MSNEQKLAGNNRDCGLSKRILSSLLLGLVLLCSSCVDQVDFPLNLGTQKLIVSGQLNNLNEPQVVYLSETTSKDREPLFSGGYLTINDLPRPLSNAQVYVVSDENEVWQYREVKPGQYELSDWSGAQPGRSYYLEIRVDGSTYRSDPEQFSELIGDDNLSYTFDRGIFENQPETAFISIQTEVTLPLEVGGYYLRWDVEEAYYWNLTFFPNPFNTPPPDCYVFDFPDPERITLLNGDLLNRPGGVSTQTVAERRVDQSF